MSLLFFFGGGVVTLEYHVMQCQFLRTQGGKCAVNYTIKMLLLVFFCAMNLRMGTKTNPLAIKLNKKTKQTRQRRHMRRDCQQNIQCKDVGAENSRWCRLNHPGHPGCWMLVVRCVVRRRPTGGFCPSPHCHGPFVEKWWPLKSNPGTSGRGQ